MSERNILKLILVLNQSNNLLFKLAVVAKTLNHRAYRTLVAHIEHFEELDTAMAMHAIEVSQFELIAAVLELKSSYSMIIVKHLIVQHNFN